ncbi:hemolysin family protein [Bdellovibrio sp. KM01]|uniref:hemolysin family protein n=1 Tax=Bdellovibrio sp. KM01 TaxID=2748865 RepID=UPI0015EADEEB|nr:hemolysin family protein [Bdellovibrio sp. KM01]QLY23982.1 HlyC/CorC family transporter [Bdellovibrio sp. KM01]
MTEFLVVILCLFINMLLSGAEMAFVTVRKVQLQKLANDSRARLLLKLKASPERTLSVIQIGITVVGAIAAAVGGAGAEEALSPLYIEKFKVSPSTADALSIVTVVLPLSYLSVVVGELVPKTLALRKSLTISLVCARALYYGEKVLSPFVFILEKSTHWILKLFSFGQVHDATHGEHDFEIEDLPHQTKQYVMNLVSADKLLARDIMVPWQEVVYVRKDDAIEDVETIIVNSGHTRIPVMHDNEIIGLINSKEFFTARKYKNLDWQTLIRPVLKFKAFEPVFRILLQMQQQNSHMAIIYERANLNGLVTMENIFEEIIGDIFDEDDDGFVKKILAAKSRRRP